MSGWNEELPKSDGNSLNVKLKNGESVEGVLLGEPVTESVIWELVNGKKKKVVVPKGTKGAKFRFKVNFAVKDQDKWVPRILEQGSMVYSQVQGLIQAGYQLSETVLLLKRDGATENDTRYTVLPTPKKLSQEDVNQLGLLNLNDLTK